MRPKKIAQGDMDFLSLQVFGVSSPSSRFLHDKECLSGFFSYTTRNALAEFNDLNALTMAAPQRHMRRSETEKDARISVSDMAEHKADAMCQRKQAIPARSGRGGSYLSKTV